MIYPNLNIVFKAKLCVKALYVTVGCYIMLCRVYTLLMLNCNDLIFGEYPKVFLFKINITIWFK